MSTLAIYSQNPYSLIDFCFILIYSYENNIKTKECRTAKVEVGVQNKIIVHNFLFDLFICEKRSIIKIIKEKKRIDFFSCVCIYDVHICMK